MFIATQNDRERERECILSKCAQLITVPRDVLTKQRNARE